MEDIIDIIVTETTNLITITSSGSDEVIDVNIIDNREDIVLNVTPTVVEININSLVGNFGVNWGQITGTLSNQTDLNTALGLKADLVGGKVPSSQLPSYVDDIVEVANYAALPATGETGKIYVVLDTNKIYRWSGSAYIEIADSTAVWGAITGTLSSQTDLQNALNAKFDDPTGDSTQYLNGAGTPVTFPIAGQAGTLVREVRNTTGATLTKGTIVYISGATGNKPTISKAIATGDSTSAQTFGMLQADIANNSNGYAVCVGDLGGLDTSGLTEGQQLYLSGVTAGAYTTTKSVAPIHLVYIGVVTRSHPTQGQIEVKIQNGYELDEIHDVLITSKANNQGLFYEASTDLWKNKSIATILGGTPITGSGTSGQVTFWNGTNSVTSDGGFLWDNTNKRLGVNITPDTDIHANATIKVGKQSVSNGSLQIAASSGPITTLSQSGDNFTISNNSGSAITSIIFSSKLRTVRFTNDIGGTFYVPRANQGTLASNVNGFLVENQNTTQTNGTATFISADANGAIIRSTSYGSIGVSVDMQFQFGGGVTTTDATITTPVIFKKNGNVLINPTADNGSKLQVTGTATISDSLGIGSTSLTGHNLRVSKTIAGATTSYAIRQDGAVQSSVTSEGFGIYNLLSTQAAAFTLPSYYHFTSADTTLGAGSAVANQLGFYATNLSGATNNYGFYGSLAAGTNKWNIYMDGTANNYLAGNLLIGSTTNNGAKLQVTGTATFSSSITLGGALRVSGGSTFTQGELEFTSTASAGQLGIFSNQLSSTTLFFDHRGTGNAGNFVFRNGSGGANTLMYIAGSGNIGIGTGTPDATAILHADSTTKGVLFPRMTTTQKNAISSPATGLVIFDTTLGKLCVFSTTWQTVTSV